MKTEAIFENIAQRIINELNQAADSIYIAVAWFTNVDIWRVLYQKLQQGISVQLILSDSEINRRNDKYFSYLNQKNSSCHYVGNDDSDLMHNKFCVIDGQTVINGSYNWSVKAEKNNHENIIITTGDTALAQQFIQQFKQIRARYVASAHADEQVDFPLGKVIKRLEILKNYVLLEDNEDIERESAKLQLYSVNEKINSIIQALQSYEFTHAVQLIDEFVKASQQIIVIDDVEISALKLEIRYLEHQLNAYDNEKAELEQILSQFQTRHSQELGELILELLHLQKLQVQNNPEEYQEAEQAEAEYKQQFQQEQEKQLFELSKDEKQELKKMFRAASQICHPDKVSEDMKEMAHETFIRLKQAYDENDIETVRQILSELENGHFKTRSETVNQKEKLKAIAIQLRQKVEQLQKDIFIIKESEEYQTIIEIEDWNSYFSDLKERLESEIGFLKQEYQV